MLTNFSVQIGCVDGESSFEMNSPRAKDVLAFLRKHDHEGGSLSLAITVNSNCKIYEVLELLVSAGV
jgi:hypothetical protein